MPGLPRERTCLVCGQVSKRLRKHVKDAHALSHEEYLLTHVYSNHAPMCECGCGESLPYCDDLPGGGYRRFIHGHNYRGKTPNKATREAIGRATSVGMREYHSKYPEESRARCARMRESLTPEIEKRRLEATRNARDKISRSVAEFCRVNGDPHVRGQHLSKKSLRSPLRYRSSWELELMHELDDDPNVVSWAYEPFWLEFYLGGERKRYLPDFIVVMSGGLTKLVEVKPAKRRLDPKNIAKKCAAVRFCEALGISYEDWEPSLPRQREIERQRQRTKNKTDPKPSK